MEHPTCELPLGVCAQGLTQLLLQHLSESTLEHQTGLAASTPKSWKPLLMPKVN